MNNELIDTCIPFEPKLVKSVQMVSKSAKLYEFSTSDLVAELLKRDGVRQLCDVAVNRKFYYKIPDTDKTYIIDGPTNIIVVGQ